MIHVKFPFISIGEEEVCDRCGSYSYKGKGQTISAYKNARWGFDLMYDKEKYKWMRNITNPKIKLNLRGNTKSLIEKFTNK